MPLVNQSISNIIGGVSQQPDSTRFSGQCEIQENALSSVVDGLTKRPPLKHIKKLFDALTGTYTTHFIDRDENEKYVVIINRTGTTSTTYRIFNLITGDECSINGTAGAYTANSSTTSYLHPSAIDDLKFTTVGDTTFVCNSTVNTEMNDSASNTTPNYERKVVTFVKQGDYEKNYQIKMGNDVVPRFDRFMIVQPTGLGGMYHGVGVRLNNQPPGYPANSTSLTGKLYLGTTVGDAKFKTNSDGKIIEWDYKRPGESSFHGFSTFHGIILGPPGAAVGAFVNLTVDTESTLAQSTNTIYNYGTASFRSGTSTGDNAGQNADTTNIMTSLKSKMVISYASSGSNDNFDIYQEGNLAVLTQKSSVADATNDFIVSAHDGLGNNALTTLYKKTGSIFDLPNTCENNFLIKIVGDVSIGADDMYVKFVTADGGQYGAGAWEETIGPNTYRGMDDTTLPHTIISTGLNTFTIGVQEYADLTCGDGFLAPPPIFVGHPITNVFFFKDRLGFLSRESISMSQAGDVFNFFRTTMSQSLDSDPINVSVSTDEVVDLTSTASFQENLILFSKTGQFVLKGGDILSNRTISITNVTKYDVDDSIDPVSVGSYIYFATKRDNFTSFREFQLNSTTDVYDSVEITEQIPRYIPQNIKALTGSPTEDVLVALSSDASNCLYVYKYFFSGNQKLLSSWSKFVFGNPADTPQDVEIIGCQFMNSVLYVFYRTYYGANDFLSIGKINFEPNPSDTELYLDFQQAGTTDSNGQLTVDTIFPTDINTHYTNTGARFSTNTYIGAGKLFNPLSSLASPGAGVAFTAGCQYTMKYRFSDQLFKLPADKVRTPSSSVNAKLRNLNLFVDKTGFLEVKITQDDRAEQVSSIGSATTRNLVEDDHRFPIYSDPKTVNIDLENNSAYPSNIQSVEFESFVHGRSKRV